VSFPAVDKGSVIELELTRTTQASPDSSLGGEEALAGRDPITRRVITLTVPEGTAPRLEVQGVKLAPVESRDAAAGTHSYRFVAENVPDQQPELDAPADPAVLPRLVYSLLPDWNAALARVSDRYLGVAVPATVPAPVKAQADKLVAGARSDGDKALAIYRFVAHDIRSVSLPLGAAGYAPNPPEVVLANRYGDDRDKVALFLALCAAEGLAAQPVLVRTHGVPVIEAVPTVAQFDRMIARLAIGGHEVWLDPSDEDGQFGVTGAGQDNLALALAPGGGKLARRPALDPRASASHITATLALNDKGDLDAQYRFAVTGWYAGQASRALRPLKGENLTKYFQHAASNLSASAVDVAHSVGDLLSVSGAIEIRHRVSVPGYAPAQGRFHVFELPSATLDFAIDLPSAGLTARKYPLWLGTPRTVTRDVTLALPRGWKVAYAPPAIKGSADGVAYAMSCTARKQAVTCHAELTLDRLQVAPASYDGVHQALAKIDDYSQRVVLITRQ
jgi:transglutaminase-like putative cysteine protease